MVTSLQEEILLLMQEYKDYALPLILFFWFSLLGFKVSFFMVRARESPHFFSLCDCLDVGLSVVGVAFIFPFLVRETVRLSLGRVGLNFVSNPKITGFLDLGV